MNNDAASRDWAALARLGADEESQTMRRWMDPFGPPPAPRRALAAFRKKHRTPAASGAAAVCLGDYETGLRLLRKETRGPAFRWRVEALIQLGRADAAAAALEEALAGSPDDAALLRLAALAALHQGNRAAAEKFFERLDGDALALGLKGFLLDFAAGDHAKALAALDRAVALRPRGGWPLALRAQVRRAREELTPCLDDLNAALALEPAGWIFALRARCFNALGMAPAAAVDLERAVKESPRNPLFHQELGGLLFNNKRYAYAARALTRALVHAREGKIKILEQRAYAHWYGGAPQKALDDLRRCLTLDPQCGEYLRLKAARIALARGRERFAREVLAGWRRSEKPEMRARAAFLEGLIDFSRRRFAPAARAFELSETLRHGQYFSGEFPAMNYSTMARALAYLKGAKLG